MRRLAFTGLMMLLGFFGGMFAVSGSHFVGGLMGALLGGVAAIVVLAFPRHHDDGSDTESDFWFKD